MHNWNKEIFLINFFISWFSLQKNSFFFWKWTDRWNFLKKNCFKVMSLGTRNLDTHSEWYLDHPLVLPLPAQCPLPLRFLLSNRTWWNTTRPAIRGIQSTIEPLGQTFLQKKNSIKNHKEKQMLTEQHNGSNLSDLREFD